MPVFILHIQTCQPDFLHHMQKYNIDGSMKSSIVSPSEPVLVKHITRGATANTYQLAEQFLVLL